MGCVLGHSPQDWTSAGHGDEETAGGEVVTDPEVLTQEALPY